jgi:hypothetical protein
MRVTPLLTSSPSSASRCPCSRAHAIAWSTRRPVVALAAARAAQAGLHPQLAGEVPGAREGLERACRERVEFPARRLRGEQRRRGVRGDPQRLVV